MAHEIPHVMISRDFFKCLLAAKELNRELAEALEEVLSYHEYPGLEAWGVLQKAKAAK